MTLSAFKKDNQYNYHTIAFYNLENLFDTIDDKFTNDDDFLPSSDKRWTLKRYRKKLRKLGLVISRIGSQTSENYPAIIGLAEVENKLVIDDLISSKFLSDKGYDLVHYDSPDERGIDVALIYRKDLFEVLHSEVFSLDFLDENGKPDHTRDILMVEGVFNDEKIFLLVNHWPSRREGEKETEPKRLAASSKVVEIINGIKERDTNPKIIIMGDFNDDPLNRSIKQLTKNHSLFNPMEALLTHLRGSASYKLKWNLFDQILFTTNFFEYSPDGHSFSKADIFDDEFLKIFKGKYKGNPFRTYVGRKYKGGYSDHFPVYIHLKKKH